MHNTTILTDFSSYYSLYFVGDSFGCSQTENIELRVLDV